MRVYLKHADLPLAFCDLVLLLKEHLVVDLPLSETRLKCLGQPHDLFLHGRYRLFQLYNLDIFVSFRILQARISVRIQLRAEKVLA